MHTLYLSCDHGKHDWSGLFKVGSVLSFLVGFAWAGGKQPNEGIKLSENASRSPFPVNDSAHDWDKV